MVQDQIRYDILVQDALRGVIRRVLEDVSKAGLPGDHHFFITFLTGAPGVEISSRLKERYPEQMTIVLQHQFWDLKVSDHGFEVSLSFGEIPEKLVIPFAAIQGFYDPTAAFETAFDVADPALQDISEQQAPAEPVTELPAKKASSKKSGAAKSTSKQAKETKQDSENKPSADVVSLDAFRKNK